ncbi:shikimate dehydrogenase [Nanoarchaeota archaeon]
MNNNKLTSKTKICAVIGDPIEHSMSPVIHNAAFHATKLDFAYVAFQVTNLNFAIMGMRALGIRGFSVTLPHKIDAMNYVDKLDPVAKNIGAINTIVNDNGTLIGYNTDGDGALKAIEEKTKLDNKKILILGAGGAARAIALTIAMKRKPEQITILNREMKKAENLIRDVKKAVKINAKADHFTDQNIKDETSKADIIINTTPIGMSPRKNLTPIPNFWIPPGKVVFDIIYNPMETKLLNEAKEKGCKVISGIEMFINQAAEQFKLFTGKPAPKEIMRKTVLAELRQKPVRYPTQKISPSKKPEGYVKQFKPKKRYPKKPTMRDISAHKQD